MGGLPGLMTATRRMVRPVPSRMAVYPGADFSTFLSDATGNITRASMDLSFATITGPRVCQETILRKLTCPPGSMDDPTWGIDLRTYLNASVRSDELAALQARVRTEILREEYVDEAEVTILLSADGSLIVDIALTLADEETYEFAFALSATGIQVILDVGQDA